MKYFLVVGGLLAFLTWTLVANNQIASAATILPTTIESQTLHNRIPVAADVGEQIARDHLLANAATLGISRADLADLVVDINFADADSGNRYVKFKQSVGGVEIYNAMLNVTLRADGSVLYVGNRSFANIAQLANSRTPRLTQSEAIAAAANALGLTYDAATVVAEQSFGTAEQKVQFAGGNLSYESIPVRLMYQPMADGSLRLAWSLDIYQQDGLHWWDMRVDALTGALLDKSDRGILDYWGDPNADSAEAQTPLTFTTGTSFSAEIVAPYAPTAVGSYRVYQIPTESPNHSTPAAPADGRTVVANPDNATASPFGWHDTNGAAGAEFTTTQGNNTHAYTDIDANNLPDAGSSPDGGAGLSFDAPLDLTLPPSGYRPAAVINLFYWTNVLHDVSYVHGFTEAARNFQENNYGNGGLGSDYINAEAQDGSETNNARYFHAAEGTNPRFQMYVWTAPNPDRDGDLDNGIILHEYGHGISLRLTGNGVSCLGNAEQMGEGWSDFQSVMLTQRASDTATTNRGVGTYALNQPTTGVGIRPAPYNTDMTVNNYTYSRLNMLAVPHGVGFLWNTMLWDLNWKLIEEHGFNPNIYGDWSTGGNNLTYRLVHDAMKIQPCSPGFVDGRDTILAADDALTGGENECLIWEAFARRGLGASASQGSSNSTSDGTQAFDLPAQCTGGPTPTPSNTPIPTMTATPGTGNRICSSTVVAIPDSDPTGTTSVINVGTAGTISDLNVVISSTHTWVGDLAFNLSNGTNNVTFFDRPGVPASTFGCSSDNIDGSVADDEGTNGAWETTCLAGPPAYLPGGTYTNNAALSVFDGAAAAGNWTLTVSDNAGGDTGTLDGWCVDLTVGGGGPTPTATPTAGQVPDINVNPGSFTETHGSAPQVTTDTMNIQNVGGGTLNWTIAEDDTATTPVEDITDKVATAPKDARLATAGAGLMATRFLSSGAMAPNRFGAINLVVDDGSAEDSIGLTAGGQFIWLNRFTPAPSDYPFTLTEIQLLTISTTLCAPTDTVDFYVYSDADGNPANGATFVGSVTGQQVGTLDQYNSYPANIALAGPGDVLILAVNRTCNAAGAFPASIDTTASQVRSWVGFGGTPGNPPTLPATTFGTIDSFGFPGNWLIRGTGTQGGGACSAPTDIPWLTVSPTNGSTAGGGSTPVTLTYNSASLAAGTYTGNLCIESNDPDEELVTVPITLNVGPPTAIDLSSFTSPVAGVNLGDLAAAGLLLLAGAVLILRRK